MTITTAFLTDLRACVGVDYVRNDPADCLPYGYDNSRLTVTPDAVAFPANETQVRDAVVLCNQYRVPLTTRGRGTNTTGASVPIENGLVLSTERMNAVVEFSAADRYAVVQPGLTNGELQEVTLKENLFWPPDPTSAAYSTIGGNLACNAGGPRAVRYGACRDNVLGLRAVTGDGRIIRCGTRTTKSSVGYDMTRTLIGSEGTLAIITEATLRLHPSMPLQSTMRVFFSDTKSASQAIAKMMRLAHLPSAVEFMDQSAVSLVRGNGASDIPDNAGAMLILVVEGDEQSLEHAVRNIQGVIESEAAIEIRLAKSDHERESLWATRRALSPALRRLASGKINEDVAVPVSKLPDLIAGIKDIESRFATKIVSFGHAGNGNLHVNLLYDRNDNAETDRAQQALAAVFGLVLTLKGTLSGEHGIGRQKRDFIEQEVGPEGIHMMRALKFAFDPNGILNPGKVLPDVVS